MDVLTSESCWTLKNEIIKQMTSSWPLFIQPLFFFYISHPICIRLGICCVYTLLLSCCSFHYSGYFECCILLVCANRYLLLYSAYLARIQSLLVWLHAVVFNSCDVHHNQFIESCTSFMWINRYLLIFSTFLAQFLSHLLIPWCRVLLEKLSGLQPVKKFPYISWNPKFHYPTHKCPPLVPILGSQIQSIYPHPTSWRSILILFQVSIFITLCVRSNFSPRNTPPPWGDPRGKLVYLWIVLPPE